MVYSVFRFLLIGLFWVLPLAQLAAQTPTPTTQTPTQPQSSPPALQIGGKGEYPLSQHFQFVVDPARTLTLQDLLDPNASVQWQPVPQRASTNFGARESAIWLRITLQAQADGDGDWLWELAYAPLDSLTLYTPDAQGGWREQRAGDTLPFASRPVMHRNHVLPIRLQMGQPTTVYARIASKGTVSAPTTLWRSQALWAADQSSYAGLGIYFGMLVGLLLYNLLLYVSLRDRGYLIYVIFAASMVLAMASFTGIGTQFLWARWVWWADVVPTASLSLAVLLSLLVSRNFLASHTALPRWDRWILALVGGWATGMAVAFIRPTFALVPALTLLAIISIVVVAAMAVRSVINRYPGARYFLLAWGMLMAGGLTLALHGAGLVPSNWFTVNSLMIGSGLEMVLLSFALGDRIGSVRREKLKAQNQIDADAQLMAELSQSQQQVRAVLQERELVLDNAMVGIAFLTPDGRFRWANRAMLDLFGLSPDQASTTHLSQGYLNREQYLQVGQVVAQSIGKGETFQTELQMRRLDGSIFWALLSGKAVSPSDLSQGTVWGVLDITQRKELQVALEQTSSEREAILNSALVGIVLSVSRRMEWVNDSFARMLGYPREELLGTPSTRLHISVQAWEEFGKLVRRALKATGTYRCERQLRRKDGSLIWVDMAGNCIRPGNIDAGVIWSFVDISQLKASQQEAWEALDQQKALNELRNRFVAMTSHEFRTPLAAILSARDLLHSYGDRLPQPERIELLDGIANSVQHLSRMVDRVLLLGKEADTQLLDFAPKPLDLVPLCNRLVEEVLIHNAQTPCEVLVQLSHQLTMGLYDEKLLRHIFGNLLSNALKYSPDGGEVTFSVRPESGSTVFEVTDQGIGIPPEEIPHLFESFHRSSNVGTIPGTGLGLAIVHKAVAQHGGKLEVNSVLGQGTSFVVWLPFVAA
jgi:PAS domain S-box-containing protein